MPPLHAAARPLDKEYRMDYVSYVSDLGLAARAASRAVARASTQLKNAALLAAADALDAAPPGAIWSLHWSIGSDWTTPASTP
jgi:hypothetical protein